MGGQNVIKHILVLEYLNFFSVLAFAGEFEV